MANPQDPFAQHFSFFRGEDVHIILPLTPPENVGADTFEAWLKADLNDADADALIHRTTPDVVETAAVGLFNIDFGSADTLQPAKTYYWALWRTTPGSAACLAAGTIQISRSARKFA
jgi:hypothetical protein